MKTLCLLLPVLAPLALAHYVCDMYDPLTVKKLAILDLVAKWDDANAGGPCPGQDHDHTHDHDHDHEHGHTHEPIPAHGNCRLLSHSCKEIKAKNPKSRSGWRAPPASKDYLM